MPNLLNPYRFGAAWTPASLTGIAAWLRADDLSGQADASAVSSWVDRVGSYNFEQATGSKQPTFYKTTSVELIGGQPTVSFDGGDLLRYAGTIASATSGHALVVCMLDNAATANQHLYGSHDEATTTRNAELLTNVSKVRWIQENADTPEIFNGSTTLSSTTPYVLEVASSGTAYESRVNGAIQTLSFIAGSNNGDWFGDTTARDNVTIGARKSTTESLFFTGVIAEIIQVDNSNLSAGERTSLNTYLNDRYGFSL